MTLKAAAGVESGVEHKAILLFTNAPDRAGLAHFCVQRKEDFHPRPPVRGILFLVRNEN